MTPFIGRAKNTNANIKLPLIRRRLMHGIMILLYGAGGVPGRSEILMSSASSRMLVDLPCTWGVENKLCAYYIVKIRNIADFKSLYE